MIQHFIRTSTFLASSVFPSVPVEASCNVQLSSLSERRRHIGQAEEVYLGRQVRVSN